MFLNTEIRYQRAGEQGRLQMVHSFPSLFLTTLYCLCPHAFGKPATVHLQSQAGFGDMKQNPS